MNSDFAVSKNGSPKPKLKSRMVTGLSVSVSDVSGNCFGLQTHE